MGRPQSMKSKQNVKQKSAAVQYPCSNLSYALAPFFTGWNNLPACPGAHPLINNAFFRP
jgi:hypothetical protein